MAVRDVDRLGLMRTLSTAAPEIVVTPSGNFAINAGTSITLNAQVAGGGNVTFQWRRNGAAIPGPMPRVLPSIRRSIRTAAPTRSR